MRTIVTVFNENHAFNSCQIHLIHLKCNCFMHSIQFNYNYQIMGDFYPLIKIFVEFLQWFFTQTLKSHNSVTNKDTETRQTFSESPISALFSRPAGFFIAGRQSPGAGRQPAEPALEKTLNLAYCFNNQWRFDKKAMFNSKLPVHVFMRLRCTFADGNWALLCHDFNGWPIKLTNWSKLWT